MIRIICVGKIKEQYLKELIDDNIDAICDSLYQEMKRINRNERAEIRN